MQNGPGARLTRKPTRFVLVGAGHANVQVLRAWKRGNEVAGVQLTVIVDRPSAVYSGMVPGVVAGRYTIEQASIDLAPLAARAGARLLVAKAVRIDASGSRVELEGGDLVPYDFASLNVGSVCRGLGAAGVPSRAVPTRPIAQLVSDLTSRLSVDDPERVPETVVVVGAGAAGLELAFAVAARLRSVAAPDAGSPVCVLGDAAWPLPGAEHRSTRLVSEALARHGITFRGNTRVRAVNERSLVTDEGEVIPSDLVIWATGPASPSVILDSDLPHDAEGFVLTDTWLRVAGFPNLFAVGDCATIAEAPNRPRAGVYAVRAGPVLLANLSRSSTGRPLVPYRPQGDFLRLLSLADGTAIGMKWGVTLQGAAVGWLKDRIDRGFVSRFRFAE